MDPVPTFETPEWIVLEDHYVSHSIQILLATLVLGMVGFHWESVTYY